jgi:NADPH-dependent 2,4-dienoyl-CoA reductase/sulfur reductase-like enzyme
MSRHYDAGTQRVFDVVVVGAGPAGMAAATAAASRNLRVAVLDDNPAAGGQIWREGHGNSQKDVAKEKAANAFRACGAELFPGRQVANASRDRWLQVWNAASQELETFLFDKLILATGARERFLPFPGWTLPGVFGAGGLQALVRGGFDVRGKRVVVAGTGPLLLAVAAHLREDGAEIVVVAEQASLKSLLSFAPQLLRRPGKLVQGAQLHASLGGASYRMGNWPVEVEGSTKLTGVRLTDGRKTWTEACDLLACGFHLVPNTELASLLGCEVAESGVVVDTSQLTTVPNLYCAGESTGIAGVDSALIEGEIAGLAAAGDTAGVLRLRGRRDAERGFGLAMSKAFALREELKKLAQPNTIVCRCEDVRYRDLMEHAAPNGGWTDAKLQTRCGMGPCQGRICGPALETLFGWRNASVRPPVFPVPVSALCDTASATEDEVQPIPQELKR